MKTVVVTGGLGFIGSNLINTLSKKNYFIINIDKINYASNHNNMLSKIKNYKFFKQDINFQKSIKNILEIYNPSIIFNLAAESHVDRSIDNPRKFIQSNFLGTYNLLEVIRKFKKKIRFIHVSTDEDFGDIKKNKKSKEIDAYIPSSPYAASKACADLLIKSYIRTYKINAIITNCCNNYGPNQYPEKFIPTIIHSIIYKKPIPIYGSGKNSREWIYVQDHCNALIKISEKGVSGENYNIGSGVELNNNDLVQRIILLFKKIDKELYKNVKLIYVKDRPGHDLRYSLNSSKIKRSLNWRCRYNFEEGLKNTILWYIEKFNKKNFFKNKDFKKRIGLKT